MERARWRAKALCALVALALGPPGLGCRDAAAPYDPTMRVQLPDVAVPPDAAPGDARPRDADLPPPDAGDLGAPLDAAVFEPIAFDIQTRVGERRTVAGLENRVTCEVLDQVGEPIGGLATVVEVRPDTGFVRTEVGLVGARAGDYEVTCFAPGLGLRDQTPAVWTVGPGAPARVSTALDHAQRVAGESVTVDCTAFDADGNRVIPEAAFTVRVEPPPGQLVRGEDGRLTFQSAGTFDVTCGLPGAESAPGRTVQVRPGLPARFSLARFPDRPVYRVGQVLTLLAQVTDRFDNPISDAPVGFAADPLLAPFGEDRFRLTPEGRYRVGAWVEGPTLAGAVLEASTEVLVDAGGPGITCDDPEIGAAVPLPPGGGGVLRGRVADVAGVQTVTVDGRPAALLPDGSWRAEVAVGWGLNSHTVVASDGTDESAARCTYFAADAWLGEGLFLDHAASLRLGQGAIDDGEPDQPLGSLGDALRRVINSAGLRDTLHAAALAQNPLVPNDCRVRVLGACLFRFGVEYRDLRIGGPNAFSLQLVDGGLAMRTTLRAVTVSAQFQGTLNNNARITARDLTVALTFEVGLRPDLVPSVRLRQVDEVRVGALDSDFSGFITGAILELAFSAFEGLIRRTLVEALRDYLTDNLNRVLADILGNVSLGDLDQGVSVPSLTGGAPTPLSVIYSLSSLEVDAARLQLGVRTKVEGPVRLADRSLGVPLPPGTGPVELPGDRTVGGAVQLALLNQVLHRLWRAGYFEAEGGGLVAQLAGDLPDGVEVRLRLPRAPAVIGEPTPDVGGAGGAGVRVFLGPFVATVTYPGFFVEPFRVELAAEVVAQVRLVGERTLSFEAVTVDALHLSLNADTPAQARQVLEATLERVLASVVDRALNDGLPTLPLPEFVLPADLARFGLPAGAGIGLRRPRLASDPARWRLDGDFGE